MEGNCQTSSETPVPLIFELPGEAAVVINGVPDVCMTNGCANTVIASVDENISGKLSNAAESSRNTGFGEWLEGREVQKLFDGEYYSGFVTEFDKETGWYRVVYEDGDFEDLEWHELRDVLKPLDITVPLKTLALKIIRKREKSESGLNGGGERKHGTRTAGSGGRRKAEGKFYKKLTSLDQEMEFHLES